MSYRDAFDLAQGSHLAKRKTHLNKHVVLFFLPGETLE